MMRLFVAVGSLFIILCGNLFAGGRDSQISLKLVKQIPFEAPLPLRQELRWVMERPIAIHPDGRRVLVLSPAPAKPGLPARPVTGHPERNYRVAWLDLETGKAKLSGELTFRLDEAFGITLSPDGEYVCTVAGGEVLVLDERLNVLANVQAELKDASGATLRAQSCSFFPASSRLLVLFNLPRVAPWDQKSALLVYDWMGRSVVQLWPVATYIPSALPLEDNRIVFLMLEHNWLNRFRMAEGVIGGALGNPTWQSFVRETVGQRLVPSGDHIFRAEFAPSRPADFLEFRPAPSDKYDFTDPLMTQVVPDPGPYAILQVELTGKIRTWILSSRQLGTEYTFGKRLLHWPLAVSPNGKQFACIATYYTHLDQAAQLRWKDFRLVIFDINDRKRPIYVSNNFGSEEAITGLAYTPDGSKLIAATSRRLLIYDIKEGSDTKRK